MNHRDEDMRESNAEKRMLWSSKDIKDVQETMGLGCGR